MKILISLPILAALALGCNGQGPEVAALIATGSALTILQTAQSGGKLRNPSSTEGCKVFCGPCEVPCGNSCMPYGTLCYMTPGLACYGGDTNSPEFSTSSSTESNCNDGTDLILPFPLVQ